MSDGEPYSPLAGNTSHNPAPQHQPTGQLPPLNTGDSSSSSAVQQQGGTTPVSRSGRKLSHLSVQTDLQPAAPQFNLPAALPAGDTNTPARGVSNLTSALQSSGLSPMSSYFGYLHGSHSFDYSSTLSPGSALPSPALSAMIDLTPLPSPIYASNGTPTRRTSITPSRNSSLGIRTSADSLGRSNSLNSKKSSPQKKKNYGSLLPAAVEGNATMTATQTGRTHGRNRSISDFVPEALHNIRPRVATLGSGIATEDREPQLHREDYLAAKRGLTHHGGGSVTLPSPPPSNASAKDSEAEDTLDSVPEQPGVEYFRASAGPDLRRRKWRSIRLIGKGTFSKVFLATSQQTPAGPIDERQLDPAKLVAVKICERGPAGGADEQRIKQSLDREIEILKSVSHPCIVRLKAIEEGPHRTELVLTYCNGGDLFEFASERRDLLRPALVQRMFAELAAATQYLHDNLIVHRDIKLENVLVNTLPPSLTESELPHPQSHPFPLVTLTDLGLSRRIPAPPESPLLTTRCGSEDYAAPELLLGQPYDGRSTDTWALGVLLYALIEGRLPFDAPPGKPDRSKNTHRIARCDWIWSRMGDEDGEWDDARGKGWEGARPVVEGCLKKVRMGRKSLVDISRLDWVKEGLLVDGGIRRREDDGTWMVSPT